MRLTTNRHLAPKSRMCRSMPPLPTCICVAHRSNITVRNCRFCAGTIQALFENEGMGHHKNMSVGKVKGILKIYVFSFKFYTICSDHTKYQRDALNIIYSSNIITLLYMFRVSSTHLQEDIVVHKQHMVPSLCKR